MSSTTSQSKYGSYGETRSAERYLDDENICFPVAPITTEKAIAKLLFGMGKYQSLYETRIVVQQFPMCLHFTNDMAQTPLHVAVSAGVSCDALIFLMKSYPEACFRLDHYGRLPLHYAAMPSKWIIPAGCGYFGDNRDKCNTLDPRYLPMLRHLCWVYPGAAVQEDKEGMSPIEYAIMDPASDFLTVRSLHTAASRHWHQKAEQNDAFAIQHWEKNKKEQEGCILSPNREVRFVPVANEELVAREESKMKEGSSSSIAQLPVTSQDLREVASRSA